MYIYVLVDILSKSDTEMEPFSKRLFILLLGTCMFSSCKSSKVILYYHDTSNIDDGEFFGDDVSGFFHVNKRIYIYKVKSQRTSAELQNIVSTLQQKSADQEIDDGWYEYAFITKSNDTLYADYRVAYWKLKDSKGAWKSSYLKSDYLKSFVDSITHP